MLEPHHKVWATGARSPEIMWLRARLPLDRFAGGGETAALKEMKGAWCRRSASRRLHAGDTSSILAAPSNTKDYNRCWALSIGINARWFFHDDLLH